MEATPAFDSGNPAIDDLRTEINAARSRVDFLLKQVKELRTI